ncbi:MAG: efflux RND transporter periplasmic adaptor subunit [Pararhodobacter sp.]
MRFLNSTVLVFLAIILLVTFWIGSGVFLREAPEAPQRAELPPPTVAASWSEAEPVTRELVLYGDVEPAQVAILRARVDGIIEETARQGDRVQAGDALAQLSTDDRAARLAGVNAQLASAQRDYDSARQLFERNIGSDAEVQQRLVQLEAARAQLRAVELEIANTTLRAPIGGTISRIIADTGSYVSPGGEVLEIVDNDPLIAVVKVQQAQIIHVRDGMEASVRFIGGEARDGRVRFISPIADAATRTFRVEVEIANPDDALPAGLSAEVTIPFSTVPAHRISSALGRLNEEGAIGVYVLDDEDRIQFAPVAVIRARADGVWVSGLPERARIVTISQGTLSPGQQVLVQETPEEYLRQSGLGTGVGAEGGDPAAADALGAGDEDGGDLR